MDGNIKKTPDGIELRFTAAGKVEKYIIGAEKDDWEMFDNSDEIIDYLEKEYLADILPTAFSSTCLHEIAVEICNLMTSDWN